MRNKVKDHLGNEYSSISDMCRAYGTNYSAYTARRKKGLSCEEALVPSLHAVKDHKGIEYMSIHDMCSAYGVTEDAYHLRIKRGWSLKDALTRELSEVGLRCPKQTDHLGNEYSSINEMCKAYGIKDETYRYRIKHGFSVEEALTMPLQREGICGTHHKCTDHIGKEYDSKKEMCEAYGVDPTTYNMRLRFGRTQEQALTESTTCKTEDHLGNKYRNTDEMCKAYGTSKTVYRLRLKAGMTQEQALSMGSRNKHNESVKDHLGNTYKSITSMALAYGINKSTLYRRMHSGWDIERCLTERVHGKE